MKTLADLRAATQIEIAAIALRKLNDPDAKIVVVAHSQGTEIFFRALDFLSDDTKKMIEFYGNGGQRFVPNDIGLKRAWNFIRSNDLVPFISNYNPLRAPYASLHDYTVYDLGRGGDLRPLFQAGITAHGWKANYQDLYDQEDDFDFPLEMELLTYPLIRLPL